MEMSGVMSRSLDSRERTPAPAECDDGWNPGPVWTFRRREKYIAFAGVRTPDRPVRSLVATQTELSPIMMEMIRILVKNCRYLAKRKARQRAVAIRIFCVIQKTEMNEIRE
jgi:hypothetical protein